MHRLFLSIIFAFFLFASTANACVNTDLEPKSPMDIPAVTESTFCLLNQQRALYGIPPLTLSPELSQSSLAFSQRMVGEKFFSHQAPNGETMGMRLQNYRADNAFVLIAENLGWGETYLSTPSQTVEGWMLSPGHKVNILNKELNEIGIGVVIGTPKLGGELTGATYTTHFGTRRQHIPEAPDTNIEQVKSQGIKSTTKTSTKKKKACKISKQKASKKKKVSKKHKKIISKKKVCKKKVSKKKSCKSKQSKKKQKSCKTMKKTKK